MKLTEKMKKILSDADLEKNEINNVPFMTAYGLESRELISAGWRVSPHFIQIHPTATCQNFLLSPDAIVNLFGYML